MSLLKKVQKRSVERKFGGTHPILRMGLDRNVIDAYFTGLVFAAVADDEIVDEAERAKLEKIGLALNLSPEDVSVVVDEMLARDGDAKVASAEEAVGTMKGTKAIQLFLCEWSQIWMTHVARMNELDDFRVQLCDWMECDYNRAFFDKFDHIDWSNSGGLKTILGDEIATYLFTVRNLANDTTLVGKHDVSQSSVSQKKVANHALREYMIDKGKCLRCAACFSVCSSEAINGNTSVGFVINMNRCVRCGKCADACDYQAIVVR